MENNLKIGSYQVGILPTNCYYVYREGSGEAVVVDPGDSGKEIFEALREHGLFVKAILLTHAHFDHILGVSELRKLSGAPVYLCENERRLAGDTDANLSAQYRRPTTVVPDVWLRDGETFTAAGIPFMCIATPGHTEGSCCYYVTYPQQGDADAAYRAGSRTDEPVGRNGVASGKDSSGEQERHILFSGDTVFQYSVGRTDFATGSMSALVRSIRDKLLPLPDDTEVYPGHGEATTLDIEKKYNDYFQM